MASSVPLLDIDLNIEYPEIVNEDSQKICAREIHPELPDLNVGEIDNFAFDLNVVPNSPDAVFLDLNIQHLEHEDTRVPDGKVPLLYVCRFLRYFTALCQFLRCTLKYYNQKMKGEP
jgi:hypothetical protein